MTHQYLDLVINKSQEEVIDVKQEYAATTELPILRDETDGIQPVFKGNIQRHVFIFQKVKKFLHGDVELLTCLAG